MISLDKYAGLSSPIHRWEQRSKLVALSSLILAFALIDWLLLLPFMVAITGALFCLSRLPIKFLLERLRYPSFFILGVVFLLPLAAGNTVIFSWGGLSIKQEGCLSVILIVTRFVCILTVSLVLFGTAPFLTTIRALRSLAIPSIIIDMMLLSYRYLEELGDTLKTMQQAMRLRGFQPRGLNRQNVQILGRLMGSLLVRSYDQSQRVYQAMRLRGYGYGCPSPQLPYHSDRISRIATALTVGIAAVLILLQMLEKLKLYG